MNVYYMIFLLLVDSSFILLVSLYLSLACMPYLLCVVGAWIFMKIRRAQLEWFWVFWHTGSNGLVDDHFGTITRMKKEVKDNLMVIGDVNGCFMDGYTCSLFSDKMC